MEDTTMGYREDFFKANPGTKIPGRRGLCWRCVNCGGWFPKSEIDVDHKISKRYGGSDQLYNLQAMCKHCNRSKRERSSTQDIATSAIGAIVTGNAGDLACGVLKQKAKDFLGIKYRR